MTNSVHTAAEAFKALRPHAAGGVMIHKDGDAFQLYSPTHGISMDILPEGIIIFEGTECTVSEFINHSIHIPGSLLRMYRHAFLKPHDFGMAVNIELNRTCSLSCPHCFITPDAADTDSSFPGEHLDRIRHFAPREISLTGGEVFSTDAYKSVIRELNSFPEKDTLTLRFLANGTWFQNTRKAEEVAAFLEENCSLACEFRFTLFDFRPEYHDLLAGSSENFNDLMSITKFLSARGYKVSHNYTINSWNFALRAEALRFLSDQCGDSFSLSSILYPTAETRRAVKKLMITPDQFKSLLDEGPFRALASQYSDGSAQCRYHCNYPLLTRESILYHCNLPGTPAIFPGSEAPLIKKATLCETCEAARWCKKCPSAVPSFHDLYCPFARIAAEKISRDCDALAGKGYSSAGTTKFISS